MWSWAIVSFVVQGLLLDAARRRVARVLRVAEEADAALGSSSGTGASADRVAVAELLREIRGATDRAAVRAVVNLQMVDVRSALDGAGAFIVASARAGLFAGTGLSVAAASVHLQRGGSDWWAYLSDALPFLLGSLAFVVLRWLGHRAEAATTRARTRWNQFARQATSEATVRGGPSA